MMQTAQPIGGIDERVAKGGVTISIKLFRIARPVTMLIEQKQRLSKWNSEAPREDFFCIPRSRHNPKILGVDDAEIVGDRITEVRPIPGNCFTQEFERRIGELGASCVALVVRDVSVHEAP